MVGGLGDSVTAGTAATATSMLDVFDESRGVSFVTGADGTWQTTPTLGNFACWDSFVQQSDQLHT